MAMYRITRFVGPDMDKAIESSASTDFVDVAPDGEGNGMVIARYCCCR